ncbi:MAG: BMP family ABC transporter substrate-binding protein [Propionibacteriales bacterium]|nr:BMP family ABC transporter substrate-binding protein [Propionibacteriales bacterium]
MSKIAVVALIASMTLTGCGKDDNKASTGDGANASKDVCQSATGTGPKVGLAFDVGGAGDRSFNDSAIVGMQKAADDLGATCISATPGSATESDEDRAERLRTLADQGYNPVIGIGFIYSVAMNTVAAEFPETNFAVIDGFDPDTKPNANVAYLGFAEQQGSYLVGVAAALKTKSKTVGFVGGTRGDLIKKFEAGYTAGVKSVDKNIKVLVTYLTEDPNDGATGFQNPSGGKVAAEGQLDKGADVIYHASGKSGNGVFEAVTAAGDGKFAIGVDSDQYLTASADEQPHILTSMLKRVDVATFNMIKSVADGSPLTSYTTYDLAQDGVGYATSGGFVDDISAQLDEAAAKIKSGEIKVPDKP